MRGRFLVALGVLSAVLLIPSGVAAAQTETTQGKKPSKEQRIQGIVTMLDAATHTFTVKLSGQGVAERQVVFDEKTTVTFRNKPSKADEVKDGRRVIVLGTPNDKKQLVARRIEIREGS